MEVTCQSITKAGCISQKDAERIGNLLKENPDIFWGTTFCGGFAVAFVPDREEEPVMSMTGKFTEDSPVYPNKRLNVFQRFMLNMRAALYLEKTESRLRKMFFESRIMRGYDVVKVAASGGVFFVASRVFQRGEEDSLYDASATVVDDHSLAMVILLLIAHVKNDTRMKMALERQLSSFYLLKGRLGLVTKSSSGKLVDFDGAISTSKMLAST